MSKKRKLRKQMAGRGLEREPALVICTGKKCAPRAETKPLVEAARAYVGARPEVRLETVGCLHICKHGPIAATFPKIRFKKRVDLAKATKLIDKLVARAARGDD